MVDWSAAADQWGWGSCFTVEMGSGDVVGGVNDAAESEACVIRMVFMDVTSPACSANWFHSSAPSILE